jgi:beta-glucosidase
VDEGEYIEGSDDISARGGDRDSLRLHEADEALIAKIASANAHCIVVLEGGTAFIIEAWKAKVPAILMAWYPGMEGGTAIGKILFGETSPSGKLPLVFPKSEDQLPFFDKTADSIEYDYYHGYKLLDKNGDEPAFPFGFGLSYTTYAYENLRLQKQLFSSTELIEIMVDVTNTGDRVGEEIVQLYVGYTNSRVDRPVKELKGFARVTLEAGTTKTVTISVDPADLAYYDVATKSWIVEPIEYTIFVGGSSRTADLLQSTFQIAQ